MIEAWHHKEEHSYSRLSVTAEGCYPFAYRRTFSGTDRPYVPDCELPILNWHFGKAIVFKSPDSKFKLMID